MGYSYTKKEMARLDAMIKKFDILMKEYKKGKSFGGYYLILVYGGKFPNWGVTNEYRFWEVEKQSVWQMPVWGFKSLKEAKIFLTRVNDGKLKLSSDQNTSKEDFSDDFSYEDT
jgi:hypothetical protein